MPTLYAQPGDPSVTGFHFESAAEFWAKARRLRDMDNGQVGDFELRFADGQLLDAELFKAIGVSQGELASFFDAAHNWTVDQKVHAIVAVSEFGVGFPLSEAEADAIDIDLYLVNNLHDLALKFVEDGVFGEVPEELEKYIDYDAIVHDLNKTYRMATFAGVSCAFSGSHETAAERHAG